MSRATGLVVLTLLWVSSASAQTQVYRCGPDGRAYSQEPCAHGRTIDVGDPRSAQQAAQTRRAALRDAREADELERARLHAERLAARQGPALIGGSKASLGEVSCAKGAACKPAASKRRSDKPHTVTLYRGAQASR
jgi:hypothetical protein